MPISHESRKVIKGFFLLIVLLLLLLEIALRFLLWKSLPGLRNINTPLLVATAVVVVAMLHSSS